MAKDNEGKVVAGWSAVVNGVTSILSTVTITLMFAFGGLWGLVNDTISVIWGLSFIPLAFHLYRALRTRNAIAALLAFLIGMASLIGFVAMQSALVARLVAFEDTFTAVTGLGGGIGAWLVVDGFLLRGRISGRVPSLTIALGVSFLLGAIGFVAGGWQSPLALTGFGAQALLGPVWAFAMARSLLRPIANKSRPTEAAYETAH